MARAYAPGLKIKESCLIRKRRQLPVPGDIVVGLGEKVCYDTVVARTQLPGSVQILNIAAALDIEAHEIGEEYTCELSKYMLKKAGDSIARGEIIAQKKSWLGLFRRFYSSPINGSVEHISDVSGQLAIRDMPKTVEIEAYVPGTVVDVIPRKEVIIETPAAFIQGIFGIGGETHGELETVSETPDSILEADQIRRDHAGKVLLGGSLVTGEALIRAVKEGVRAIVVGGVEDKDLTSFLGYRIGVAITGHENLGLTLILTEGSGRIAMSKRTYDLLKKLEGKMTSVNGATQIRAGVIRPEIIVPREDLCQESDEVEGEFSSQGIVEGTLVRIIREPYFGHVGRVIDLPSDIQTLESEVNAKVIRIELDGNRAVLVPRANVEIIEE